MRYPNAVLLTNKCNLQMLDKDTTQIWDTYLETFDHGKVGSKTFRVDLLDNEIMGDYDKVLIAGTKYQSTNPDGFPEGNDFEILFDLGDELIELIEKYTDCIMVGSFLYNGERLEYFYIKETDELIKVIENFYKSNYPDRQFFVTVKEDKEWMYYKEFLLPKKSMQTACMESITA